MKDKTQKLLIKAQETIEAAELLANAGKLSSAAGRAYYAMFYVAIALLHEQGLDFRKHGGVHAAFGLHFTKPGKLDPKFHRYLLDAFETRQEADYDVYITLNDETVREMIRRAKEFLAAGKALLEQAS